jgi:hypothetical protein
MRPPILGATTEKHMVGVIVVAIVAVLVLARFGLVSKQQIKVRSGVRWFAIGTLVVLLLFILVVLIGKF